MFKSISVSELDKIDDIIIDIRSNERYNNNHIKNSINIPANELLINANKYLSKDKTYYIYCQKGIQSRKICELLSINDYNAVNIRGGYEAWILNQ